MAETAVFEVWKSGRFAGYIKRITRLPSMTGRIGAVSAGRDSYNKKKRRCRVVNVKPRTRCRIGRVTSYVTRFDAPAGLERDLVTATRREFANADEIVSLCVFYGMEIKQNQFGGLNG